MSRLVSLALLAMGLGGCAQAIEQAPPPQDRVVLAVDKPAPTPVPDSAFDPEPSRTPPRLSRVVTLGQTDAYAPGAPPPMQTSGGPNVVVNNNVTVVTAPPVIYGGYYGGGGYARGSGYATGAPPINGSGYNGSYGRVGGGETAQGRPAAPGTTPGVGGNWTPAPSYGPRPLR